MKLIGKGSMLYSVLHNRCPRCNDGLFWEKSNPYVNVLANGAKVNVRCSHCDLKYERETGFWYGAMYVSYAIGIGIFVASWVAVTLLMPEDSKILMDMGIMAACIIGLFPVNYYLSRLMWINFFVSYEDPEKVKSEKEKVTP